MSTPIVMLLKGRTGKWFCAEHRPADEGGLELTVAATDRALRTSTRCGTFGSGNFGPPPRGSLTISRFVMTQSLLRRAPSAETLAPTVCHRLARALASFRILGKHPAQALDRIRP